MRGTKDHGRSIDPMIASCKQLAWDIQLAFCVTPMDRVSKKQKLIQLDYYLCVSDDG